ncbi:hypothetical protein GLE_0015 [Lysobacter enzymogenes]|uniref:Uncharacterized protein n=1 Tax=Lysobacter enzymogenes TaxID=69 RepID=A0A0S2DA07_LYSEN|nr:hypothetical protein GLE_0015 [Lysobacter enzymogenes]
MPSRADCKMQHWPPSVRARREANLFVAKQPGEAPGFYGQLIGVLGSSLRTRSR